VQVGIEKYINGSWIDEKLFFAQILIGFMKIILCVNTSWIDDSCEENH